jgi:hypothetical protein
LKTLPDGANRQAGVALHRTPSVLPIFSAFRKIVSRPRARQRERATDRPQKGKTMKQ